MHQLNDQWIETIDGEAHMVKAVRIRELLINSNHPTGIVYQDLGILRDGLLPEERTGEYPTLARKIDFETMGWVWVAEVWGKVLDGATFNITVKAQTKQQAINAWNRRA